MVRPAYRGAAAGRLHVECQISKCVTDRRHFNINALYIRNRLIDYVRDKGVKVVIIDHGGLMNHNLSNTSNGADAIGETTKILKQTAKELNIIVVLIWQLNRGVESSSTKKPMLSSLRGSGRIEEDADKVMFVYRESYYDAESQHEEDDAEPASILLEKCRNGITGEVDCVFNPKFACWENQDDNFGFSELKEPPLGPLRGADVPF